MPHDDEESISATEGVTVAQTREIWERIATWWDDAIGEGNDFQQQLIIPATDRLLEPRAGQVVLDVACGNGNYSRHLARLGVRVVGCDFSETFLGHARARGAHDTRGNIDYIHCDATDESALLELGVDRFDAIVCSMAMMDMPTIDPLLCAGRALLRPGVGRFVFSLPHPCFNSNRSRVFAELVNEDGQLRQIYGVKVTEYAKPTTDRSAGILNQPEPHYLFHRPLGQMFAACFRAGFVVDALEEPTYPEGTRAKNAFSWAKRPQIPPAIVIRLRPNQG